MLDNFYVVLETLLIFALIQITFALSLYLKYLRRIKKLTHFFVLIHTSYIVWRQLRCIIAEQNLHPALASESFSFGNLNSQNINVYVFSYIFYNMFEYYSNCVIHQDLMLCEIKNTSKQICNHLFVFVY